MFESGSSSGEPLVAVAVGFLTLGQTVGVWQRVGPLVFLFANLLANQTTCLIELQTSGWKRPGTHIGCL